MIEFIIIIFILSGYYYIRKYTKNMIKCCCNNKETLIKERINIDDTQYPIKKSYKIEGISCENCAIIIERRLNKNNYKGILDFNNHILTIHSKVPISHNEIKSIVESSGYSLIE